MNVYALSGKDVVGVRVAGDRIVDLVVGPSVPCARCRRDLAVGHEVRVDEDGDVTCGDSDRCRRAANRVYFAVCDIGAHEGYLTSRPADDAWLPENPDGWTYQDVTGAHGSVLYEGPDADEVQRVLDAWLNCDAPATGSYCYSHNS